MIHIIIGTRAQLIKTAPIFVELQKRKIPYNFIFTAQHKETMFSMMKQFGIKNPGYVLGDIGKDITKVSEIIPWFIKILAVTLIKRKEIFKGDRSGVVVVHGDAPPALLGALMAKITGLKVAHNEAGLRSFNLLDPFPEEIIRILVAKLTDIHFYPWEAALKNLERERFVGGVKIDIGRNTLYDTQTIALKSESGVEIPKGKFAVASFHRFETISRKDELQKAITIVEKAAENIKVLFVLHPPTREQLHTYGLYDKLEKNANIELKSRYNYIDFNKILAKAELLLTDGGGNQEESSYLGIPCLVLRRTTERPEGVGENVLISKLDLKTTNYFLKNYKKFKRPRDLPEVNPTKIIVDFLEKTEILKSL